jgi:hypothetical protein
MPTASSGEEEEHHQLRHRVVADVFFRVFSRNRYQRNSKKTSLHHCAIGDRQPEDLLGVVVADEGPVDAAEQPDGKM